MKIAVFADVHVHPFKNYSTVLSNGLNSRVQDSVSCMKQIFDYCKKNKIKEVLFAGDMFHTRKSVTVQALKAVYDIVAEACCDMNVRMIHGNHDQADREGNDHSLHTFRDICTIVDKPSWIHTNSTETDIFICAVPYVEDVSTIRELIKSHKVEENQTRIFLGHFGLKYAKIGADFVYEDPHDADINDLSPTLFDVGFLGHFHMHQNLGHNFYYVGSPLQHTWGDVGQDRGFMVYDTDTKHADFISLVSPRFVRFDSVANVSNCQDCFVQIIDTRVWSDDEKEDFRQQIKARTLEIIPLPEEKDLQPGPRIDFQPGMSYQDIVEKYVKSGVQSCEGLNESYLTKLGLEFLLESDQEGLL